MTIKTEGNYTGEFILSEANGNRSRRTGVLISGQNLLVGQVVGLITASSKYSAYVPGASDGTETVAGILYASVDASAADADCVVVSDDAEVKSALLVGNDVAGTVDLEARGVRVRA